MCLQHLEDMIRRVTELPKLRRLTLQILAATDRNARDLARDNGSFWEACMRALRQANKRLLVRIEAENYDFYEDRQDNLDNLTHTVLVKRS